MAQNNKVNIVSRDQIQEVALRTILNRFGYDRSKHPDHQEPEVYQMFGKMIHRYFTDSIHNNWEGFEDSEISAVTTLLADMLLYSQEESVH